MKFDAKINSVFLIKYIHTFFYMSVKSNNEMKELITKFKERSAVLNQKDERIHQLEIEIHELK